ncbi:hypothetical protein IJ768_03600 [Candidatus Saccharibacteria bacterium]|nr:hypothetical protein [Candidatus Saccharibacteria bacterium]
MSFYPEANLEHVHPPNGLIAQEAARYLSENDEKRLAALLHAVLQSNEDTRFSWPEISRGNFEMKFFDNGNSESKTALAFSFAGKNPGEVILKKKWFNLVLDDDEVFDIQIRIFGPEVSSPKEPGWHALCLARNLDLDLAFSTLKFFEILRPHNKKLQACIEAEKRIILNSDEYEYSTSKVWCSHLEELERSVKDALSGGIYAPMKANFGLGRIPQLYRDYCVWFKEPEK